MKVEIVEARLDHLFAVMENMRDWERAHCLKLFGNNLEQEAARMLARSLLAFAGFADGKCVIVWGVHTDKILSETGYVWMLGTKFLEDHPIPFLRHTKRQVNLLRESFSRLYGTVLTDLSCGEKWLKWLGFEVGPDEGGIRVFVTR